jgi:hypothetical protein
MRSANASHTGSKDEKEEEDAANLPRRMLRATLCVDMDDDAVLGLLAAAAHYRTFMPRKLNGVVRNWYR